MKGSEGIEYTEAISKTLNEKAYREMVLGGGNNYFYARIVYMPDGPLEESPGKDIEEAISRKFNGGSPAWFGEKITFHNQHALERIKVLIERFGYIRLRKQNCKIQIFLGNSKKPVTGDYGYLQEVLRYAMEQPVPEIKEPDNSCDHCCSCCSRDY